MKNLKTPSEVSDTTLSRIFRTLGIHPDHASQSSKMSVKTMLVKIEENHGIRMTHRSFVSACSRIFPDWTLVSNRGRHLSGSWFVPKTQAKTNPVERTSFDMAIRELSERRTTIFAQIAQHKTQLRKIDRQISMFKQAASTLEA